MDEIKRSCGGALPADGLPQELISLVSSYTGIDYDYSRPEKGDRKDDPRKGKADEVKDFIYEKLLKDVNYEAAGVAKEGLPSYTKVITENFEERDMEFIGSASAVSAAGGAGAKGVSYNGDRQQAMMLICMTRKASSRKMYSALFLILGALLPTRPLL